MLTGKQKRFLRSKAHHLNPIFQIGKSGLTEQMIFEIEAALEVRELIKVSMLQNCEEPKEDIQAKFEEAGIEVAQQIGNIFVLYKESEENKMIKLP
ncbi:ribosome assembly RNA-binding protein YhbY [Savagea sp. SN6]|uniref:Ribosome assembly RNA-binding protein YhbY n=1 Tax=Savagea serpentis TaxID=2785297 RepID=A0A8J7KGS3_9BACL|nr:ribosome assembly RNA-binding protein YhbY [Savagea serpentis]MBF4500143.1 ribosome assembly RNA-binding protein YhbY [Savagea serpentis]